MTKKLTLILVTLCLAFAFLWSCQRDSSSSVNPPNLPVQEKVMANIRGRVIDDTKQPVGGVAITAGGLTATTDINGYFTITNATLIKNAGFVQAVKTGYFTASRTLIVHPDVDNTVEIQLIPKKAAGNFVAASGGTIAIASGGSVTFPANAIINPASNAAYSGSVTVSVFYLDPSSPDLGVMMPGDLRGIDTTNKEVGLRSFGMMVVELNGASGEKLQLASGKQASVTFPIAAGLQATAPSAIPLWFFNDSTGLWKEEGTALKQGTTYVGNVAHFSFWNCDLPVTFVNFEATFKDQNGNPLKSTMVTLTRSGSNTVATTSGFTDINGLVSGKVPANESLVLNVYSVCGDAIYTKTIGPFSSDTKLDATTINISPQQTVTISGQVTNCSNASVANGVVNINVDGQFQKAAATNGTFSISILRCSGNPANASITAFDLATNKLSSTKIISVTTGTIDAGVIKACDITADRYVVFNVIDNVDTTAYSYVVPTDTLYVGAQYITAAVRNYTSNMQLSFANKVTATGPVTFSSIYIYNSKYFLVPNGSSMTGNITEYGPTTSDHVSGNFSAMLKDSVLKRNIKVEGIFRVMNNFR
jgi:hypothetical protein